MCQFYIPAKLISVQCLSMQPNVPLTSNVIIVCVSLAQRSVMVELTALMVATKNSAALMVSLKSLVIHPTVLHGCIVLTILAE